MKNKMKQLFGIILSLVLVLGLMPGMSLTAYAASETTVEYDLSVDGKTINKDGVTCTNGFDSYNNNLMGGTFTTSNGKFTKIVVNADDADMVGRNPMDMSSIEGWSSGHSSATWTGNSSSVQFGSIMGNGGNVTITFTIEPSVDVTGVSLNKNTATLTVGDTETLTATVSPDDATDKSVTWSSDNTSVATVDTNGLVTAVGSGTANITVTTTDGSKTASCAVTVNTATVKSSVTLNVNGGTINSGNITEYTEGTGATLPTDVTKDGHQFGGWYDNAGLTGSPVTAISTSDTGNKEYWAKWTANPSSVSYSVVFKVVNGSWDDGNTSDKSITLSGMEGDTLKLSSGQIPAVGTKPNDGYKAGSWDVTPSTDTSISSNVTYTYTYVADSSDSGSGSSSSGSSDNTNINTDTSAKVSYDDVAISTGSVNDITGTVSATAESNPFGTKIENNSNLTTLLSLTDAEVAQGVNVWLDIQDMSASVSQTDKTLIQNTSGDYTVGLYLDINLLKKVGSNDATKVTETNGKVKASIVIPESLWKSGRTFEIIRVHDGVVTAIEGTYDENTHVFTFETDKFSTYALAYKDSASSSNSGTTSDSSSSSNSGSSNSSNSTQSTAPKTGDPNDVRVWYLFLIASLGGLGFLGLSKKKEN